MARTVARSLLRTRVLQRANMENHTAFAATTECNDLINEGFAEVWDLLVAASPPDYYSTEATITVGTTTSIAAAGTLEASMAYALAADFYKLRAVMVNEGNGEFRPIAQTNESERQYYRAPAAGTIVVYRYIHAAPQLGSGDDALTFDGVNGWEELCVLSAAINLLSKEGTDASLLMAMKGRQEARITAMSQRNYGEPPRVLRRSLRYRDTFRAWANTCDAYAVRGPNLELYRASGSCLL